MSVELLLPNSARLIGPVKWIFQLFEVLNCSIIVGVTWSSECKGWIFYTIILSSYQWDVLLCFQLQFVWTYNRNVHTRFYNVDCSWTHHISERWKHSKASKSVPGFELLSRRHFVSPCVPIKRTLVHLQFYCSTGESKILRQSYTIVSDISE